MLDYVWLVSLFPLIGFIVNGLLGRKLGERAVGILGFGMVGLSFLVLIGVLADLLGCTNFAGKLLPAWPSLSPCF